MSDVVQSLNDSITVFNSGFSFLPSEFAIPLTALISIALTWLFIKIIITIVGVFH